MIAKLAELAMGDERSPLFGAGDNAVLFVDQHRVGEAKFADRGGDLRNLLVAVRARVSGVGDQRRAPAPNIVCNVTGKPRLCFFST